MNKTNLITRITLIVLIAIVCSPTDISADPLDNNNEQLTLIKKKHEVPFKAKFNVQAGELIGGHVDCWGSGNASHLGMTRILISEDLADPNLVHDEVTLIAANGDELTIVIDGTTTLNFPFLEGYGTGDITGGSGRFEYADGSISAHAIVDLTYAYIGIVTSVVEYTGTIIY